MKTEFKQYTVADAPTASRSALQNVEKALGFVPNLFATLAESPVALEGYLTLDGILAKGTFTGAERQLIQAAVSSANGCAYCAAAHSAKRATASRCGSVVLSKSSGFVMSVSESAMRFIQRRSSDKLGNAFLQRGHCGLSGPDGSDPIEQSPREDCMWPASGSCRSDFPSPAIRAASALHRDTPTGAYGPARTWDRAASRRSSGVPTASRGSSGDIAGSGLWSSHEVVRRGKAGGTTDVSTRDGADQNQPSRNRTSPTNPRRSASRSPGTSTSPTKR